VCVGRIEQDEFRLGQVKLDIRKLVISPRVR